MALHALLKMKPLGEGIVARALSVLARAQPEAENAFRAPTIIALCKLLALNAERIDEARLVDKLADMALDDEIEKARSVRKAFGGNTEAALQLVFAKAYNKGLSEDRRLPEKV